MSQGRFDEETETAYLSHSLDAEAPNPAFDQHVVNYFVPQSVANDLRERARRLCSPENPCTTLVVPIVGSLLYMDVGRWGGSGSVQGHDHVRWRSQREFGLVCGRVAALCAYGHSSDIGDSESHATAAIESRVAEAPDYKALIPLLDALSLDPDLGDVAVTDALCSYWPLAECPRNDEVHLFLGDLHVPVMTDPSRAWLDGPDANRRVPLRGRLDPDLLDLSETATLGAIVSALTSLLTGGPIASSLPVAALSQATEILAGTQALTSWSDADRMYYDQADGWFNSYHGGHPPRGADIFEQAGADLSRFVRMLRGYQMGFASSGPPVRFVQLGDLFDFWVGMQVAFDKSAFRMHNHSAAEQFIRFWKEETLEWTASRDALSSLFRLDHRMPRDRLFRPTFLYGNHDNYCKTFGGHVEQFVAPGLKARHGHQCDTFNHDSDPTMGWAITQLAFLYPALRDFEEPAGAWLHRLTGSRDSRLISFESALDSCLFDAERPVLTYVQGHTHRPLLRELHVVPMPTLP